jgi:hypothetical protein
MRLKGQVEMGIYRVGKPLGVVGIVLKSRVCLVLLGLTSSFYSSSGVCLVVPMRISVYYLQNMAYYLHSMFGGPPYVLFAEYVQYYWAYVQSESLKFSKCSSSYY